MSNKVTLEQLEQQVDQLPLHEQLKLIAYVSEQLGTLTLVASVPENDKEQARQERLVEVEAWLAECEEVAELWEGAFDSAADLRRIRDEGSSRA